MAKKLYALSISGRLVLDMHSLNNEGGEGNQTQTRMVTIVHPKNGSYEVVTVNAISGDMFKHILAEHFYRLAKGSLKLCKGCERFSASRVADDEEFMRDLPDRDSDAIDRLLERCALDDVAGNLIAEGGRSVPRKSVAEFGWVVGLPEATRTDSYFHVRYAAERGTDEEIQQRIFHRPASSGIYAVVASFELARIGFNDITQTYPIGDDERKARHRTLLRSALHTFVEPNGAMRGTQNPHILGFEGVVTCSEGPVPAPVLSPLQQDYQTQLESLVETLSRVNGGTVRARTFSKPAEFAAMMEEFITDSEPYRMSE
jgi:CRISPR-associated protein Cst2